MNAKTWPTDYVYPTLSPKVERFGPVLSVRPQTVVAIPVKDEADRLPLCLDALAGQTGVPFEEVTILLLLNNCTDGTEEVVRQIAPLAPYRTEMHIVELTPDYANAGWARRLSMDAAADIVAPGGVILTTDADTIVDEDWIEQNRREISSGLDAVAGYVMADPMELMELPETILERGRMEWQYQQLVAELQSRSDPEAHDPWPRHNQNCGASAAVTLDAYRRIGGLPPIPVGEDRALFEMIRRIDGKIRHSLDVHVVTSARTDGRAMGGLSDAIRLRGDPEHPCDDALEVAVSTFRRAVWRRELREIWETGRVEAEADLWARKLGLSRDAYLAAAQHPYFGQFWAELEALSLKLEWRLVTGALLKRELRRIRRLVAYRRAKDNARAAKAAAAPAPSAAASDTPAAGKRAIG
jgi:hypothetical protein